MKKLLYIIFSALLLAGAGAAWYVYENAEGLIHPSLIPPDYYWLDDKANLYEETGIVAIAGREFKIPVAYVDGRFKDGRMEGSVVLEYVLPDFKSKLEFSYKEKRMQLLTDGFYGGLLLDDPSTKASFEYVIDGLRQRKRLSNYEGIFYGLEKWTAPKPDGKYATKPDDTFLEKDKNGNIISYFQCSPLGEDKVPGCRHIFENDGIYYSTFYGMRYFPEWKQQQMRTIQFIDNFKVTDRK